MSRTISHSALAFAVTLTCVEAGVAGADVFPTSVLDQPDSPIRVTRCAADSWPAAHVSVAFSTAARSLREVRLHFDAIGPDGRRLRSWQAIVSDHFTATQFYGLPHAPAETYSVRCGVNAVVYQNGDSWNARSSDFSSWTPFDELPALDGHQ